LLSTRPTPPRFWSPKTGTSRLYTPRERYCRLEATSAPGGRNRSHETDCISWWILLKWADDEPEDVTACDSKSQLARRRQINRDCILQYPPDLLKVLPSSLSRGPRCFELIQKLLQLFWGKRRLGVLLNTSANISPNPAWIFGSRT